LDSSGLGQGQVLGSCEYGNEPLGSIKGGEFWLAKQLLAFKDSAIWSSLIGLLGWEWKGWAFGPNAAS